MSTVALVVDDEPDLVEIISMHIEALGIKAVGASRIELAKEQLNKEKFDLILSDVRMPEGSGVDLLHWLRNEKKDIHTPMFLMTGFSDVTIDQAYAMGADGFFMKPLDFAAIKETVIKFVKPSIPLDEGAIKKSVSQKLHIISEALEDPAEVQFGRIGCFISPETVGFKVSDVVELNFVAPHLSLECVGIVRWKRRSSIEGRLKGVGIEFLLPPTIKASTLTAAGCDWKDTPWAQTVAAIPLGNS